MLRLQNSPYFCVFKYGRAVKQNVWNEATPRFTDFLTDFEKKNRLFCSLNHACQHTPLKGVKIRVLRANESGIVAAIRRISTSNSGTQNLRRPCTGNFQGGSDRSDVYNEKRSIRKVKMNPKDI